MQFTFKPGKNRCQDCGVLTSIIQLLTFIGTVKLSVAAVQGQRITTQRQPSDPRCSERKGHL